MARVSIEDCQRQLSNRFALVMAASHRARLLMGSARALVSSKNKEAVTALREIADGQVKVEFPEPPVITEQIAKESNPVSVTDDSSANQAKNDGTVVTDEGKSNNTLENTTV